MRGDALDAERAVCGCLLQAGLAVARDVLALLAPEDLSDPRHAAVVAAAQSLVEQGTPPDPVTVLDELRRNDLVRFDLAALAPYLIQLMQTPPSLGSATHYARAVWTESYRRRVAATGTRLQQAADGNSSDLVDFVVEEFSNLLARSEMHR